MVRDKLKKAVKRAGLRLFGMERQAEMRENRNVPTAPPRRVDDEVIPRVVDGSGDTPGPNHKTDIGRTWVAAQLLGGEGVVAVDVRSPSEWKVGHLPHAILLPHEAVATHLDLLPHRGTDTVVAVYDATGEQESGPIAELLRDSGWPRARRLRGGFAEWVEEGEEVVTDAMPPQGPAIGDSVLVHGDAATIWHIGTSEQEPRFAVVVQGTGEVRSDLAAEDLAR